MRIPINWLKEFVDLPKDTKALTDKLTMVGHMLEKIDVVNVNSAYNVIANSIYTKKKFKDTYGLTSQLGYLGVDNNFFKHACGYCRIRKLFS